jgi:hypothetical protein
MIFAKFIVAAGLQAHERLGFPGEPVDIESIDSPPGSESPVKDGTALGEITHTIH